MGEAVGSEVSGGLSGPGFMDLKVETVKGPKRGS